MTTLTADIRRLYPTGSLALATLKALLSPRFHPVLLYRAMRLCVRLKLTPLAYVLALTNLLLYRVEIALSCAIGPGLMIPHGNCVISAVRVGANFTIFQGCTIGTKAGNLGDPQQPISGADRPVLGDGVVMYCNAVVVGPITVGDNSAFGANTFTANDVPAGSIVLNPPATVKPKK